MNKVAVVTGASRGIGRATAEKLLKNGWCVALCCNKNKSLANEIAGDYKNAKVYQFDVANGDDCEKAVAQIIADFGTITALVNNAGVALYKLVTETTDLDFDRVMNVNFKGTFNMTRAILPHMINRKNGAIVNVSSMWGISGGSMETIYSASKAAIIGFTKAVAKEVGLSGVRVNAVAPGVIMTDMTANLNDHDLQALKDETPLNALGTPEDVANTISFLLSNDAKFITGQTISVDGGMII